MSASSRQLQVGARGGWCNTVFIYLHFFFCYATTACNIMQKTVYSLAFSIFINPCALIATVEMMGNQMAEIEDFKIDPKTGII